MKIAPLRLLGLFLLGAIVAPFGDHGHVVTGTTVYTDPGALFLWDSAWWFVLMVGAGTAVLAELRLHLGPPRHDRHWRHALGGIVAVMGIYALTALLRPHPLVPGTILVVALGVLVALALADRAGVICGLLAAVGGVGNEVLTSELGLFHYAPEVGTLFGVAPWLTGLYFAFGVTAALLGELAAKDDEHRT